MNNSTNELKYKVIPIGNARDLRGKKFGRLTVLDRVESVNKRTMWLVQCECGNKNTVDATSLTSGNTKSCGCLRDEVAFDLAKGKAINITGEKFGRLTAIRPTQIRSGSSVVWQCECECGLSVNASLNHLRAGRTQSCGCIRGGANHYKWNPKLTREDRESRGRQANKTRNWRNKVFERDNYTCVICRQRGGRLNAHHLNSWDTHEDERFLVSNGVTLCRQDHISFHKKYGYGENTKEQFSEYVEINRTQENKIPLRQM